MIKTIDLFNIINDQLFYNKLTDLTSNSRNYHSLFVII